MATNSGGPAARKIEAYVYASFGIHSGRMSYSLSLSHVRRFPHAAKKWRLIVSYTLRYIGCTGPAKAW